MAELDFLQTGLAQTPALAKQAIDKAGASVTFTRRGNATDYNPTTGAATLPADSPQTVKAILKESFELVREGQGLVRVKQIRVTIAHLAINLIPEQNDTVTINSVVYYVQEVKTIYNGSVAVMHRLYLKPTTVT